MLESFILPKIRKLNFQKQFLSGGPGQDVKAVYGGVGGGQAHTAENVQFL